MKESRNHGEISREILLDVIQSQAEPNILQKFPISVGFGANEELFTGNVPILLKTLPKSSCYKKLSSMAERKFFYKFSIRVRF